MPKYKEKVIYYSWTDKYPSGSYNLAVSGDEVKNKQSNNYTSQGLGKASVGKLYEKGTVMEPNIGKDEVEEFENYDRVGLKMGWWLLIMILIILIIIILFKKKY